jgi:hypothetical protein
MRVATNTDHPCSRRLPQVFSGNAVGTSNPNTFHSNVPTVADAMGVSGSLGLVGFIHDSGATRTFTIFYWDAIVNQTNPAEGWIEMGPNSGIYQQAVDPFAKADFTVPVHTPFFIVADAAVANLWMSDCKPYTPGTDLAGGGNLTGGQE